MRCLITNDDGFDAPGIRALHAALRDWAEVVVAAPATQYSGVGHGAPPWDPITVETHKDPEMGDIFVIHGKPADCVRLALLELASPRPDCVISGINRGGNVGVDIYYSGTFAAAREAAILGLPAVSMSQLIRPDSPDVWPRTTDCARIILQKIMSLPRRKDQPFLWNVNIPHLTDDRRIRGVMQAPMATTPTDLKYVRATEPDGHASLRYCGKFLQRNAPRGSDVAYLFDDWVTVTPVGLDSTLANTHAQELDWPA